MSNTVIGSARFSFSTLTSTNRFATQLLSKTRPRAGTVISADFQTHGQGQYGRSWFGTKGKNLYVSVILYPQLQAAQQFRISALAALATRETVAALTGMETKIKWPNDIWIGQHKVAGILIQNSITGQTFQDTVIGIGINVNEHAFPEELPNPASLQSIAKKTFDLCDVRELLITNLNSFHLSTFKSDMRFVRNAYETHLYKRDQIARFEVIADDKIISGTIRGVDDYGRLIVNSGNSVRHYSLNEIQLLK